MSAGYRTLVKELPQSYHRKGILAAVDERLFLYLCIPVRRCVGIDFFHIGKHRNAAIFRHIGHEAGFGQATPYTVEKSTLKDYKFVMCASRN